MLVSTLLRAMEMQSTLTALDTGGQGHLVTLPKDHWGYFFKSETNRLLTLTDN